MENNGFKRAGNLNDNGMSYFQRGGSLEEPIKVNESLFRPAGDLELPNKNNSFRFEEIEMQFKNSEEIREWLKTIVSGKKKSNYAFGEGLLATSAGQKFVSIEEIQQMVKNGYNIIKAEYFENMNMVMIEFESFSIPSKSR